MHGGNEFDDDDDDQLDDLNCTFNNGRQVQGLIGGSGDPEEDVWCIRKWLRMPLFDVDEDTGVARCMARCGVGVVGATGDGCRHADLRCMQLLASHLKRDGEGGRCVVRVRWRCACACGTD